MDITMITDFFKSYGWQLSVLALSGIVLLGLLKWFGVFKKVDKSKKKYLYFSLSVGFSIIACTIYLLITKAFNIGTYAVLCSAVVAFTLAVYGIWENTGLRALWKKLILDNIERIFKFIIEISKENAKKRLSDKEAVKLIKEFGINAVKETLSSLTPVSEETEITTENKDIDTTQQ